jgi:hypothetical protein
MRRADHSFRGILPRARVCVYVCVCVQFFVRSRNVNRGDLGPTWAVELHKKIAFGGLIKFTKSSELSATNWDT